MEEEFFRRWHYAKSNQIKRKQTTKILQMKKREILFGTAYEANSTYNHWALIWLALSVINFFINKKKFKFFLEKKDRRRVKLTKYFYS